MVRCIDIEASLPNLLWHYNSPLPLTILSLEKFLILDIKQLLLNIWYLDTAKCQTISPKTENGLEERELYDKYRGNGQEFPK